MPATDLQVQQYVDQRVRVRAEQLRAVLAALRDDKAAIDDVYAAVAQPSPTWTDARTDGPPRLLGPNDVLAYNSFVTALIPHIQDAADWPAVLAACVRPVGA